MSHYTAKSAYKQLAERLDRFPQGAPGSETLFKILRMLFEEKEARLVSQLPIKPFTAEKAAHIWKCSISHADSVLEKLADRALLLDLEHRGIKQYMLPPPMAGFFEFALMRVRADLDQKLLSQLYHQYLQVEEDFIKDLFFGGETRLGRTFVQEGVLSSEQAIHILDYERASYYIESATHIGISMCYCRHKNQHLGQACSAPMDICMTFNQTAAALIRRDYARPAEAVEGLELLHKAWEHNLVQCGENVREGVSFICHCCGCCCEALVAARKYGILQPVHTTNYIPVIGENPCSSCELCVRTCPIGAISMVENGDKTDNTVCFDEDICLGCGVCARICPCSSILLQYRGERIITPVNSVHRIVLMAIERGKLPHLIFDNPAYLTHRGMAALLSAILKMPLLKRAMASRQLKSVYLERLIQRALPPEETSS